MSLLVGIPFGAVEVISLVVNGFICDRFNNRILIGANGLIVAMVGMIVVVALPTSNTVGRLIGYYLTGSCANAFVALLSLISTNIAGYTKKTTVAAIYLIGVRAPALLERTRLTEATVLRRQYHRTADLPGQGRATVYPG